MSPRTSRTVLGIAIALVATVIALFALALAQSASDDRDEAESRFRDRARVTASLTESIFASSAGTAAAENAENYGGETVSRDALDRQVREGSTEYAAVIGAEGQIIQASSKFPADARERIEAGSALVRAALRGAPFQLGDFVTKAGSPGGGIMEYAAPFTTTSGPRVLLQGFSGELISAFIGGYLARIPEAKRTSAHVIDSKGQVVGSPVKGELPGSMIRDPGLADALQGGADEGEYESGGAKRRFVATPVGNSTWRVVLATRHSDLYAGISSRVAWLVLVALGLVGVVAVVLLSRTLRAAALVEETKDRLERSNEELERSNLELKRSNSELEQFASVASHDLQEPLRKVQTFGDQLERLFGDEIPDEGLDYLRRMRRAANRMSTLIEDLLRFSRVTTHARPPEPVQLTEVATEVTSDLDTMVRESHGHVEIGRLPEVEADPMQMRQLMQNLIANGVKFHKPGVSPEVRVEGAPSPEPGTVAFTVSDNGIGFESQYSERIFRVFERLHPRDVYEGTGIGLALCRKIVERHGGEISVRSIPDEGSTFLVTLPAHQPDNGNGGVASAAGREVARA